MCAEELLKRIGTLKRSVHALHQSKIISFKSSYPSGISSPTPIMSPTHAPVSETRPYPIRIGNGSAKLFSVSRRMSMRDTSFPLPQGSRTPCPARLSLWEGSADFHHGYPRQLLLQSVLLQHRRSAEFLRNLNAHMPTASGMEGLSIWRSFCSGLIRIVRPATHPGSRGGFSSCLRTLPAAFPCASRV